jgi:ankyrin repeat protein
MYAAQAGEYHICNWLLYYGAQLDYQNSNGMTAFDLAYKWGHNDVLTLFENYYY